ncbi:sensor histidine kinase N-terminal domain-containing protein, partial [Serratia marcescens]
MKRLSLRLRLILIFSLLALMTWCTASVVAWVMSRNTINEVFDTQQMLFAKRLATASLGDLLADESARSLPKTKKLVHHGKRGDQDDDALAFAIFDRQGKMLLNDGENGADFLFDGEREGFTDGERKGDDDSWRLLWLTSPDGRYRIVVGQEWDYRRDMALGMVTGQLVPWLATLPVLMLLIALMVGRELRPLRAVAAGLRR